MRVFLFSVVAFLCCSITFGQLDSPAQKTEVGVDSKCGTQIDFAVDYESAFEEARKTGRPLFVVHLSGDLRNSTYT